MGKAPDFLYCKELLENTGIVTVPGSGFRQVLSCFEPPIQANPDVFASCKFPYGTHPPPPKINSTAIQLT